MTFEERIRVGAGEGEGLGVGPGVGVGVGVACGDTFHIHFRETVPFSLLTIAVTFHLPATALVFV